MATEHLYYMTEKEAAKPVDAKIDDLIEHVNRVSKAWGEYLKAIRDIHHKYPDVKFYLYAMYS